MSQRYYNIAVRKDTFSNISVVEKIYRRYHPELDGIPLSKDKLLKEVIKFYAKGLKEEVLLRWDEC